jgi:hypothetical protein
MCIQIPYSLYIKQILKIYNRISFSFNLVASHIQLSALGSYIHLSHSNPIILGEYTIMTHELKWIISILTYRTAKKEFEFRENFHFRIQIAMQSKIISPENGRDHVGW